MKILIGQNIKRLRREKELTQEDLAEYLNISVAAVSKWERGETYPDISLLFPLAQFFGVTLDDLMGYDEKRIEAEVAAIMEEYQKLREQCKWNAQLALITKAHLDYPNSDIILYRYMWDIAGDWADNDPAVLLARKDELLELCERILAISNDENLRLDTWNMRAKILHAEGKTEEALTIYQKRFPSFYSTVGQKTEQLFAKDTPEFRYYLRQNLYELTDFTTDKHMKDIWFCGNGTGEEKYEKSMAYLSAMETMGKSIETPDILFARRMILSHILNNLRRFKITDIDPTPLREKLSEVKAEINAFADSDSAIEGYLMRCYGIKRLDA